MRGSLLRDMPSSQRTLCSYLLAILLIATSGALAMRWFHGNGFLNRPLTTDAAHYRLASLPLMEAYGNDGLAGLLKAALEYDHRHPPLMVVVGTVIAKPFGGLTPLAAWWTAALFAFLFFLGSFHLARTVLPDWAALGALAFTLFSVSPFENWNLFFPQLPMLAFVMWGYSAAVRSRGLTHLPWCAALGLFTGLAMLTKVLAPLYLVGAVLAAYLIGIRRAGFKKPTLGLLVATATAFALTAPWYLHHLDVVLSTTTSVVDAAGQERWSQGMGMFSIERWTYYPLHVLQGGLGWPLAAVSVLALGLFPTLRGRLQNRTAMAILLSAMVASYVALTLGQCAARSYYAMHMIPIIGIGVFGVLMRLRHGPLRNALLVLLLAAATWNIVLAQRNFLDDRPIAENGRFMLGGYRHYWLGGSAFMIGAMPQPEAEDWPNGEIVDLMAQRSGSVDCTALVLIPQFPHPYVYAPTLEYEARLRGLDYAFSDVRRLNGQPPERVLREILEFDYLVYVYNAPWTMEMVEAFLLTQGRTVNHLMTRTPVPSSTISLYAIGTK